MIVEFIQTLYDYNAWANDRVLSTCARLTPEQLQASGGASFDSLHDTLVHTMGAQWIWLSRWQGTSPKSLPDPAAFPDLASIRARWDQIESDCKAFVSALKPEQLTEVIAYVNTRGERWAYPLWQQMVHLVNHGTQHRSEAAVMLTHFGHSPGLLDLLHYYDLVGEAK